MSVVGLTPRVFIT
ncbi:response regulator, partial [Vibrio parahaemolyticus V-223/04]